MKKLNHIKLFEDFVVCITSSIEYSYNLNNSSKDNYKETSWSMDIDGKEVTITIDDVENFLNETNVPIVDLLVDDIFHLCIHKDKKDEETLTKSEETNLDYPIIIAKGLDNDWSMILDGNHRLLKAKNNNENVIKSRVLDLNKAPREFQIMFS